MKKIGLIVLTLLLNAAFYSCSPESISENSKTQQSTIGDDGEILPPETPND
jgi:hypothetical protein